MQDNRSAILLEKDGKKSSSQRTRAININFFYIMDQIEKGYVRIEYCCTDNMIVDYFTKPLQGGLFNKFKHQVMGKNG